MVVFFPLQSFPILKYLLYCSWFPYIVIQYKVLYLYLEAEFYDDTCQSFVIAIVYISNVG